MATQQQAQRGDELFDVVNEHDEIIGQATRREVHARGLLHRAVHVMVYDRTGRILLQKRSLAKDSAPGRWASSCSGHVDAGEDYLTAAVRELGEEIGLHIAGPHLLTQVLRVAPCAETEQEFVRVYRLQSEGPFVFNKAEIDDGRWFFPAELEKELLANPDAFANSFRHLWALLPPPGGS